MKKDIPSSIQKLNVERLLDSFLWATLRNYSELPLGNLSQGLENSLAARLYQFRDQKTKRGVLASLARIRCNVDKKAAYFNSLVPRPLVYSCDYSVGKAQEAAKFLRNEFLYRQLMPVEEVSDRVYGRQVVWKTLENLLTCLGVGVKTFGNGQKFCFQKTDSFKDYVDFAKEVIKEDKGFQSGVASQSPLLYAAKAVQDFPERLSYEEEKKRDSIKLKTFLLYGTAFEELCYEGKAKFNNLHFGTLIYTGAIQCKS